MRATSRLAAAIVGAEDGEQHRAGDAGGLGPAQVPGQVGAGVPGPGEPVAAPGMAMAVDDHDAALASGGAAGRAAASASAARSTSRRRWPARTSRVTVAPGAHRGRWRTVRTPAASRWSWSRPATGSGMAGRLCTGKFLPTRPTPLAASLPAQLLHELGQPSAPPPAVAGVHVEGVCRRMQVGHGRRAGVRPRRAVRLDPVDHPGVSGEHGDRHPEPLGERADHQHARPGEAAPVRASRRRRVRTGRSGRALGRARRAPGCRPRSASRPAVAPAHR